MLPARWWESGDEDCAVLLAIDQGTSGTKCLIFDLSGELVGYGQHELAQYFPQPGWVEQDAMEIWRVTHGAVGDALADAGVEVGELAAVGIANQRETVIAWDRKTGEPLHRAIVWQDRRTIQRCEELRAAGYEPAIRAATGLRLDPYFSATKISWLLENIDGLAERARAGRAVFGTVDSWLVYMLTGEFVTEPGNASRTLLFDLTNNRWDPNLLDFFGVPEQCLATIGASAGRVGVTDPDRFHGHTIPITALAGDQQAALFGHGCVDRGDSKATFGTGSFLLTNTATIPLIDADGLLTTVAWRIGASTTYAVEAAMLATGAAVQWLRSGLQIIDDAAQTEGLARSLAGNDGVFFVPALSGLGSPYWDPFARGMIIGITTGTTRAHFARAALEAIAFQTVDCVRSIEQATGTEITQLRVDGGPTKNGWLMQFQADVLGIPIALADTAEITGYGAAMLAGVGADLLTITGTRDLGERMYFYPTEGFEADALIASWHDAVTRSRDRRTSGHS